MRKVHTTPTGIGATVAHALGPFLMETNKNSERIKKQRQIDGVKLLSPLGVRDFFLDVDLRRHLESKRSRALVFVSRGFWFPSNLTSTEKRRKPSQIAVLPPNVSPLFHTLSPFLLFERTRPGFPAVVFIETRARFSTPPRTPPRTLAVYVGSISELFPTRLS